MKTDDPAVCQLCNEALTSDLTHDDVALVSGLPAHRVCLLRAVVGGIGHHVDHDYWCNTMNDPDGGRTMYQSALEVDALLARRKVGQL